MGQGGGNIPWQSLLADRKGNLLGQVYGKWVVVVVEGGEVE